MDCSLLGSSVHGILQAKILEWVAISFSRRSSQPSDKAWVSCIAGRFFTLWAISILGSPKYRPYVVPTYNWYQDWRAWKKKEANCPESIKLLEENIGKTLSDINLSRILYDPSPRISEIKAKINKWDLIKIKIFCTTKETISKVKRQPSEWEKIIANE